tara:strand:- start:174036 stop:175583 length:1548 start_codon:yes stop_codon:yes gene_type:complete
MMSDAVIDEEIVKEASVDQLNNWFWRINHLYHITDRKNKDTLFKLNAAQAILFRGMHYRNIILKARQLGFTTFKMIFMLDAALFNDNTKCGVIAHNKDDAGRLFREKIKYAYDKLPQTIREQMRATSNRAGEMVFSNGSSITVGTSFRGGTLAYLHISEFGKICAKYPDRAREIVTGAFESVGKDCVITIESTAEGKQGYFFNYCQRAEQDQQKGAILSSLEWKFFFFPWFQDPEYTIDELDGGIPQRLLDYFDDIERKLGIELTIEQMNWYTLKERSLGDDMKREYPSSPKEAFDQVIEGAYYARQFSLLYERKQITRVPHEPSALTHSFWDLGVNDMTCIFLIQQVGREYRVIDYYENHGEGIAHYIDILRDKGEKLGYRYGLHVAPHDIGVQEFGTGLTRKEQARSLGFNFEIAPKLAVIEGIEAVRAVLPLCWFDESRVEVGLAGLQAYRKEWDARFGVWKNNPAHDDASHPADAFRTFAQALRGIEARMGEINHSSYAYEVQPASSKGYV